MTIQAIETRYAGCRFRSRLEARWAVFFDRADIKWQYEVEGFRIFGGRYYLPDFYLPETKTWVEVKGDFGAHDLATVVNAVDYAGLPGSGELPTAGLLVLDSIPRIRGNNMPVHTLFRHNEGVEIQYVYFDEREGLVAAAGGRSSGACWSATGGGAEDYGNVEFLLPLTWDIEWPRTGSVRPPFAAYEAARAARFEHGERP